MATLLLQPPELRPSIILLDEPELGLHPYAITLLASMIKSAEVDTQVIISTQSSLLLDHFEPEDILVTELEEGATTTKRLNAEEIEQWLDEYSTPVKVIFVLIIYRYFERKTDISAFGGGIFSK